MLDKLIAEQSKSSPEILRYKTYLERKFKKYFDKKYDSIDGYVYAMTAMMRALSKYQNIFELDIDKLCKQVISKFEKANFGDHTIRKVHKIIIALQDHSTTRTCDERLAELKYRIKEKMLAYMLETMSDETIKSGRRSMSPRRLENTLSVLKIVNGANTSDQLIQTTEDMLATVETGLFFRSLLRQNVREAIEEWKKEKPVVQSTMEMKKTSSS